MQGTSIPQPPGFTKLSKTEQIRYLQALWDLIAENPAALPVPDSHLELAEQRLDEHRRDPAQARPAHDVLDRLAKSGR
jgi:putative addiction module component (TIGR02574 family)